MNEIKVQKVNNGFIIGWSKYLKPEERIDSQRTRGVCMVAKDSTELLLVIEIASKDIEDKYLADESGFITR